MFLFNVTFEIVTPESAEHGDVEESGFIVKNATLRDALEAVQQTRTNEVDGAFGVEASDSDVSQARWITVLNGMEFTTGANESRSIHFPAELSGATRVRIARLLGVRILT